MKTAIKKSKIITDADIDGPMMSGKGMTKAEALQMAEWVKEQKELIKAKQDKSRLKKSFS